jgi:hypothetical protein
MNLLQKTFLFKIPYAEKVYLAITLISIPYIFSLGLGFYFDSLNIILDTLDQLYLNFIWFFWLAWSFVMVPKGLLRLYHGIKNDSVKKNWAFHSKAILYLIATAGILDFLYEVIITNYLG